MIWLKSGPKEEEWGKLENGIYGIGTGGHIDEFCRFVDEKTILLAEVNINEIDQSEILKESHQRMEENFRILKKKPTRMESLLILFVFQLLKYDKATSIRWIR